MVILQCFVNLVMGQTVPNDNCLNVTPTQLVDGITQTFTGTTDGGAGSTDELTSLGYAVVWEAVTLPACGTLTVDFSGTPAGNMNQPAAMISKNCIMDEIIYPNNNFTCDDGNLGYTFKYLSEGTYYLPVMVDEQNNTLGVYTMNVKTINCPPPPFNDNCEDVTPTVLTNGTQVSFTGTTEMKTGSSEEINVLGSSAVWEAVTLTGECNTLEINYCGTDAQFATSLYYATGCPISEALSPDRYMNSTCEGGNDENRTAIFYNLPPGTYYLPVLINPSNSNPQGAYTLNVLSKDCPPPPANDNCENVSPTILTNGTPTTFNGTTVGATVNPSEMVIIGNRTVVWEAVTISGECNTLTISYCGTPPDMDVSMNSFLTKTCSPTVEERIFSQNSNFTSCEDEKLTLYWYNLTAGTYYIPVVTDLSQYTPGEYKMTVLSENCPPPPANDNCEDVLPTELINGIPVTLTGSTLGGTSTSHEINVLGKPVVWEAVTLTGECNNLTIDFCSTSPEVMPYWRMLKVYLDSCTATAPTSGIADNTSCPGTYDVGTVRFYDLPAGTYYLPVLVNYSGILGEYTMNVLSEDCPVIPDNDSCEDAVELTCSETYIGSTMGASDSGGNPAKDVFYTYQGNGSEEYVTLSLCGSDYDTFIRVYTDCNLTEEIASNDNFCGSQSQVSFISDGSTKYVIMVEGAASNFGNYELKINCIGTEIPTNDQCENAIDINCGDTLTGNTTFATDSGGQSTPDVFYSYTGNGEPELVTVSLCNSSYNTFLSVIKDCTMTEEINANGESFSCNGNQSELSFISDGVSTYLIMVEGKFYPEPLSKGAYEISVTCDEAPSPLTCDQIGIPSDHIRDAMTLGHEGSFGSQYAVDIPVGNTGFTIEGFSPTVFSPSSYFNFIFFEDNGGLPGTELFTRAGNIVDSEVLDTLFSVQVIKYKVKFDPVVFQPNKTYWVQIDCGSMGWGYTEKEPMRLGYSDVAFNWNSYDWEKLESQNQLAFELICSDLNISDVDSYKFSYHPNPVNEVLYISSDQKIESILIHSSTGELLYKNLKLIDGQLDVSSLNSGIYLVKAMLQGGKVETFKLIKN